MIDIFLQSTEKPSPIHIALPPHASVRDLKEELINRKIATSDSELLLEDEDEVLASDAKLGELKKKPIKIHVSRCKSVAVSVTFNGRTIAHEFSPSTTVAKVHRWSTKEFGLTPDDASEHVLQLHGSNDRPSTGTHVGSLARDCKVAFDLLPNERVQG